jgi:hypothetical protein
MWLNSAIARAYRHYVPKNLIFAEISNFCCPFACDKCSTGSSAPNVRLIRKQRLPIGQDNGKLPFAWTGQIDG